VKEFSDSEIIECLRKRQSYVVQYLSDRYLPMIRLMIFQSGGTHEDAHDIFQDGLIILLEKLDDPGFVLSCKFKTYLYCVCENLMKRLLEKRKAAANYFARREEEEPEIDFSESLDQGLCDELFSAVFETMDPVSKTILNLYWQDISAQDIADKLGYTYGYVRKKKCEAQNELTDKIKQHPSYKSIMGQEKERKEFVR